MKSMNIFLLLSLGLNLLLGGALGYHLTRVAVDMSVPSDAPTIKIAIFEPAVHPAIEEISQGFMNTMRMDKTHRYEFKQYNAQGSSTLQQAQAQEIVHGDADLIFTIGASCTQLAKELTAKKEMTTPVVFAAVDDPLAIKVVESLASSGNNLTGVQEKINHQQQVDMLVMLKPEIKKVVLVYNPTSGTGLEKNKDEVTQLFARKNVQVTPLQVYSSNEIQQKVSSFIDVHDVVMILVDNTTVAAVDALITLCNRHQKLLYASDLNSGHKGAGAAFGVKQYEYGVAGAQKAQLILQDKKQPSAIPITAAQNSSLRLNRTALKQQAPSITAQQLDLISVAEVIE